MELLDHRESLELLRRVQVIAVLGMKAESESERAAHWIPSYMASVGYTILPVPVDGVEVETILGQPVGRTLADLSVRPDIVSVFRRPEDVASHFDDLLASGAEAIWFQSVCMCEATAVKLYGAGMKVACSCIGCMRATITPSYEPLDGQIGSARVY